jgi:hypothetical protein
LYLPACLPPSPGMQTSRYDWLPASVISDCCLFCFHLLFSPFLLSRSMATTHNGQS